MFAWGWQTWGPAQRIEPFPEILRCIVCCGDGGAALLAALQRRVSRAKSVRALAPVAANHLNPNFFRRLRLVASIAPTDRCPCFHPRWMTRQSWFPPSRRGTALPVLQRAHAIRA